MYLLNPYISSYENQNITSVRYPKQWLWPENFYNASSQYMKNKWTEVEYPTIFIFNIKRGNFSLNIVKQSIAIENLDLANESGTKNAIIFLFNLSCQISFFQPSRS